jgi:hypothetical protein
MAKPCQRTTSLSVGWMTAAVWGFVGGLRAASASAAEPVAPPAPAGLTVWSAGIQEHILPNATPPPGAPPPAVRLTAPANGVASGQVVLFAPSPFAGPRAVAGDLKAADGVIPAARVRVRYADPGTGFVPLLDAPIKDKTVQPVWVTVQVPPDVPRGVYQGTLTLAWADTPLAVPVSLTVSGWKIPDPREWANCTNLLQSPEAVAGHYGVPMWSDAHFALIEKSFEWMGRLGNDVLGISAVRQGVFGDDPLILFRREGDTRVPEWKPLERYLDLYEKHCGRPLFLAVNVWNYNLYRRDFGRGTGGREEDESKTVAIAELQGNAIVSTDVPMYGRPGSEAVWQPVFDGLAALLKKRGWPDSCLLLGTGGDMWPSPATVEFFKALAPQAQWRVLSHGSGAPRWSYSDESRIQPNGMICGYYESARRIPNNRVRVAGHPVTCNSRDDVGTRPATYRGLAAILDLECGYDGVCWKGIDYWTYKTAEGTQRNPLKSYSDFGNMVGGTPRAICHPGPHGAVATQQYENFREGLQECEALYALRAGANVLSPPPFKMCDVVELVLKDGVCRPASEKGLYVRDLTLTLVWNGDRIDVVPQAWHFNAFKREGHCKVVRQEPTVFEVKITLDRDPASGKDCEGTYRIEAKRQGDRYAGSYTGAYRGYDRKGAAAGSFCKQAYRLPVSDAPPPSDLAKRVDVVSRATLAWYKSGCKPDAGEAIGTLYATAQEVADAVAAKARR